MRKFLLLTYTMAILVGARAHAQNNRSAVSLAGFDTSACTVPDPCRTFGVAISKTNTGGEILVLSSGGYGQFTIDRSVSIICPVGLHAAIAPTSGEGITINALNTDQVVIRNLYLNGLGATTGIHFQNGAMLFLDSIVVDKFNGIGIWVAAANSYISINNTVVRRTSNTGIYVPGYSGPIRGTINNSRVEKTANYGIHIPGDSKVTITNTTVAGNGSSGFFLNAEASVESCVSSFNGGAGVEVLDGIARVSNSTITNNQYGFFQSAPGVLQTRGNNTVQGNGTDISGTPTSITGN